MNDPARAFKVPSAMTKTPRNPPNPPDAPPRRSEAAEKAESAGNPFASLLSQQQGEAGGETKLYEVPRELIEIARARAANPKSSSGTLTPIAPRPNAELEATLAAYTAGLSATGRPPSSQPAARKEVEALRSQPAASQPAASQPAASQPAASQPAASSPFAAHEESGTVLRRDAAARGSDSVRRGSAQPERPPLLKPAPKPADSRKPAAAAGPSEPSELAERVTLTDPASAQQPLLRSPIAPRNSSAVPRSGPATSRSGPAAPRSGPAAPRSSSAAPRSKPPSSAASQTLPWLVFVGLCLILGYCAHRFLLS